MFELGETVKHKSMFGRMVVLGRAVYESLGTDGCINKETLYRCRNTNGGISDFTEIELKKDDDKPL